MKKIIINIFISIVAIMLISSCKKQLDLAPISSISDANYWQSPDQFDAFVSGLESRFRSHNAAFQALGELRSDIFGTEPGNASAFTGEATQGLERMWLQTINLDNTGVSNFGGFYSNIVQLNLLINKLNTTNIVTATNKNYYLGMAYGMRAFYYFQILRSWGDAVIQTDPVTSFDISNLAKAASPEADVMALVKSDIDNSVTSFGSNYTFRNSKSYWSKAASLMLKAEVYLWTSHRTGGAADATIALNALTDIQTNVPSLTLLPNFASVFAATNKGNNEIILSIRYLNGESSMGFAQTLFLPQSGLIANFYDSVGNRKFDVNTDNWGGLLRAPVKIATFRKFDDKDSRKWASIQPAYNKVGANYIIAGCFTNKYQGEQINGSRVITNDFPIYRYADLLLMIAEAKVVLGQSPATEINQVRARAFGANYVAAVHGFPNQPIDVNPNNAILQERLYEFVFEGKRWYDLRRMGDSYVYAVIPASQFLNTDPTGRLLWAIDRNSLTNNRALVQNPGYAAF
ncbi:MAG: SusD family outer membrane lipoprotein NanU [Chitinophagaceae bacterium]|nr:SusD family outer membrane lipoprotein NanU [Chitinophagaceae bacterium]